MRIPLRFIVALLLAVEVALTIFVAVQIGFLWTVAWFFVSFILGIAVMKRAGSNAWAGLRAAAAAEETGQSRRPPAAGQTVLLFVAGLLLAIPGALSDIVGLLLLIPLTRRLVAIGVVAAFAARFPSVRSTFTQVRLADGSTVIQGDVVEDDDQPGRPRRPGDDESDPPVLPPA